MRRPHTNHRTEAKLAARATRSDHSQEAEHSSGKSARSLAPKTASVLTVKVTPNQKHEGPTQRPTSGGRIRRQDQGISSQLRDNLELVEVREEPGNEINDREAGDSVATGQKRPIEFLLGKDACKTDSAVATLEESSTEDC